MMMMMLRMMTWILKGNWAMAKFQFFLIMYDGLLKFGAFWVALALRNYNVFLTLSVPTAGHAAYFSITALRREDGRAAFFSPRIFPVER